MTIMVTFSDQQVMPKVVFKRQNGDLYGLRSKEIERLIGMVGQSLFSRRGGKEIHNSF